MILTEEPIGYKQREKISKALKTRSSAIRSALNKYNSLAGTLTPPRPKLDYHTVISYSSLGEFDLLRSSRYDIREQVWATPRYREALDCHYKVCSAQCEITRLNIEIKRLRTFIADEEEDYEHAIQLAKVSAPGLAAELNHRWKMRAAVNATLLRRLDDTASLPGFTGSTERGKRIGRAPRAPATVVSEPSGVLAGPDASAPDKDLQAHEGTNEDDLDDAASDIVQAFQVFMIGDERPSD